MLTVRVISKYKHVTYLLGLDSGLTAVSSIVAAECPVVDCITVVVPHKWLEQTEKETKRLMKKKIMKPRTRHLLNNLLRP